MTQNRYRVGELCPLSVAAECQGRVSTTVKATGTKRAWVMSEDAPAARRFEDLLELRDRAHARGYDDLAEAYTERIVAEVCPDTDGPGHGRAA